MKVYRYVRQEELNIFLRGDFHKTGSTKFYGANCNNHRYKKGISYLHFFKDKSALEFMRFIYRDSVDQFYICTFDIPRYLLILTSGKGFYPIDDIGGLATCREYAIPNTWMRLEYLIDFHLDDKSIEEKPRGYMVDHKSMNAILSNISFLESDL